MRGPGLWAQYPVHLHTAARARARAISCISACIMHIPIRPTTHSAAFRIIVAADYNNYFKRFCSVPTISIWHIVEMFKGERRFWGGPGPPGPPPCIRACFSSCKIFPSCTFFPSSSFCDILTLSLRRVANISSRLSCEEMMFVMYSGKVNVKSGRGNSVG